MKAGVVAAGAFLVLAGCGQGASAPSDRALLVQTCTEDGEAEATCGCIADAMENNLPSDLFRKTAQAIGRDRKDMMTFVGELSGDEQLAFTAILSDLFACSLTGETG
ncbi:MAG: hypothetical protein ACK4MQ_11245 [Hyphomonas sp.]